MLFTLPTKIGGVVIHPDWITGQWDRMGHFYASLESGHTTASTGLKRLVGYTGKNHFYRANQELGRVFKTEHILRVMSDPVAQQQIWKTSVQLGGKTSSLRRICT